MNAIRIAILPVELDLRVLDRVLDGIEAALVELGAARVWVELHGPSFVVMADLPETARLSRSSWAPVGHA